MHNFAGQQLPPDLFLGNGSMFMAAVYFSITFSIAAISQCVADIFRILSANSPVVFWIAKRSAVAIQ